MIENGFYSQKELKKLGFCHVGAQVRLSRRASVYNPSCLSLGDHCRIDDFCVLSASTGGIHVGAYVHIGAMSLLVGQEAIHLEEYSGIAGRVCVYSSSDDYTGETLTNPTIPDAYKNCHHAPVTLKRHVIVGAGSVILPGVTIEEGGAVGALSLVTTSLAAFGIYAGIPVKRLGERRRDLLACEQHFRRDQGQERGPCVEDIDSSDPGGGELNVP